MTIATCRSWLYVPGDRSDRFDKAAGSGADVVICDLEDAVPEEAKPAARQAVAGWLGDHSAFVRINASGTPWHDDDLAAIASKPGLRGVVTPKADSPSSIARTASRLPAGVALIALIETARAVARVEEIAGQPGIDALAFGSVDFALDVDIPDSPATQTAMLYARSRIVIASRVAGIDPPIDGVTTNLDDPQVAERDATHARALGFAAKQCIHPRQVQAVNRVFSPHEDEIRSARRVLAAVAEAPGGTARVNGQMIDKPVITRARRTLARAQLD
jgi:citrate lyase subunit beta/citryl-CoA lyase